MNLYYAKGTISIAVAIALEESGIEWSGTPVDFASAEQTKPPYLKLNPKGRVPALETDSGDVFTETGALLEYIADLAPGAILVPEAPDDACHMRSVMYYLASTMHVNHAHGMRGNRWADKPESFADMKAKVPDTMAASAAFVEAECLRGTYVLGDTFSIADAYLFIVCSWLETDGVRVADFPAIEAFLLAMEARPSVSKIRSLGML